MRLTIAGACSMLLFPNAGEALLDANDPGATKPWTRHGKVRARLEKDGALEVEIESPA